MRFLHTRELTFHEFHGNKIPEYAILSHTWGDEEVTHQEMMNLNNVVRAKSGFAKISQFLVEARDRYYNYAWIDTCCIDKGSSAELTEAINSMYNWYRNAGTCFVHISDVHSNECEIINASTVDESYPGQSELLRRLLISPKLIFPRRLKESRWFRRGFTLQELVASRHRRFFSRDWKEIQVTIEHLASITSIPQRVLRFGLTDDICVAQKMCWASTRETTRTEDIAYCLLGIFDVNMPLLYGEGAKAFLRLQEEIIRRSDDETIFLWRESNAKPHACRGLLARHPSEYAHCANMTRHHGLPTEPLPYSLTNTGLQMSLRLVPVQESLFGSDVSHLERLALTHDPKQLFVPILHCGQNDDINQIVSIILLKIGHSGNHFTRISPDHVGRLDVRYLLDKSSGQHEKKLGYEIISSDPISAENFYCVPLIQHIYISQPLRSGNIRLNQGVSGFLFDTDESVDVDYTNKCEGMTPWANNILDSLPMRSGCCGALHVKYRPQPFTSLNLHLIIGITRKPGNHQNFLWGLAFSKCLGRDKIGDCDQYLPPNTALFEKVLPIMYRERLIAKVELTAFFIKTAMDQAARVDLQDSQKVLGARVDLQENQKVLGSLSLEPNMDEELD
ncbi:HET-domain-containing protein [Polyplosphaeria fusca]|uniref:HET-domain-containing protein n=1 Tax=Polyplosphaeria fusca TaxID=682080 RepID=A0A9P4QTT8_9PLEO|nr:HET-domain-containing protein [Polyplosphaeria fusca]